MLGAFPTLVAVAALWIAVASPSPTPANKITITKSMRAGVLNELTPEEAACDPSGSTAFNPSCWETLDMDSYVRDWWMTNRDECDTLGFAQCFLKYNHYAGLTCNIITAGDTCDPPDSGQTQWDSMQQFYTVWNIYAIHQFFSQYYVAIGDAQALAIGKVGDIVLAVNPPHDSQVDGKLLSILIASSFAMFAIGKEFLGSLTSKVIYIGMSALAGGSSQVANYMYDQGGNNYNQETVQIASVQSRLSDMTLGYLKGIASMIESVQGDPDKFLKLCSAGGFTQRMTGSLPDQTSNILDQLKLYILSLSLQLNNFVVSVSPNTNPMDIAKTTNRVNCVGYDGNGVCDKWWYDANTHTTYTLQNMIDDKDKHYRELTQQIWQNGWSTPTSLYAGDTNCNGKDPYLDDNGVLQCPSFITKCIAINEVFDVHNYDDHPEFTNCPNVRDWLRFYNGFANPRCVPCSYLGPQVGNKDFSIGCYATCG